MKLSKNIWLDKQLSKPTYRELLQSLKKDRPATWSVASDMIGMPYDRYYITGEAMKLESSIKVDDMPYTALSVMEPMNIALFYHGIPNIVNHITMDKDGLMTTLFLEIDERLNANYSVSRIDTVAGIFKKGADGAHDDYVRENVFRQGILKTLIYLFMSDVDTQLVLSGRSNGKPRAQGKIMNDSPYDVQVVTSKWNTITINPNDFTVGGHFRLQPYGKERKFRRLQYIKPYIKHGYKRRN